MTGSSSSKRSPRPDPINTCVARAFTTPFASSARSSSDKQTARSYTTDSATFPSHHRSGSEASASSMSSYGSASRKVSASPTVNVYTTCGRHSNQWLFSGWTQPFKKH